MAPPTPRATSRHSRICNTQTRATSTRTTDVARDAARGQPRPRAVVAVTGRVLADTVGSSGPPPRVVPADEEDVMLVDRIGGGDAEALGELYDRYGRVAFGMLYRMLPGPEAAEEVA